MAKKLFSQPYITASMALMPSFDHEFMVNYFAEGALTRLSNAIHERLTSGLLPRRLRFGVATGCRGFCCHSWQIVEITDDGKEVVIDETEDLMDWVE